MLAIDFRYNGEVAKHDALVRQAGGGEFKDNAISELLDETGNFIGALCTRRISIENDENGVLDRWIVRPSRADGKVVLEVTSIGDISAQFPHWTKGA